MQDISVVIMYTETLKRDDIVLASEYWGDLSKRFIDLLFDMPADSKQSLRVLRKLYRLGKKIQANTEAELDGIRVFAYNEDILALRAQLDDMLDNGQGVSLCTVMQLEILSAFITYVQNYGPDFLNTINKWTEALHE